MPKPYPREFREDVIRVARNREPGRPVEGHRGRFRDLRVVSERTGSRPPMSRTASSPARPRRRTPSCASAKQADPAARAGERGPAPGGGVSVAGEPAGKMIYPLVRELADDGIPVTVTCRVLKIARQPYYRWLAQSGHRRASSDEAHLANALFDAHRDDPEFGYRFLADEVRDAGHDGVRTHRVARSARDNGWWSVFGKNEVPQDDRSPARPRMTTSCAATSPLTARTSCGSPTSPSTAPRKGSSTSARSRTCSRTGSSATRSTAA